MVTISVRLALTQTNGVDHPDRIRPSPVRGVFQISFPVLASMAARNERFSL